MKDPRQLAFWDDEGNETWNAMNELLMVTLLDGAQEGIAGLPANYRVLVDFNLVNQNALNFARSYRYDWISKINDTTRTQVQQAITDWMREGSPLSALESRLTPIFSPVRAKMIAVTETTRVYAEGNKAAWDATGVVSESTWNTTEDDAVCEICGPMDGQVTEEEPPAHVGCRCFKKPVVNEEAVAAKFAEIFK